MLYNYDLSDEDDEVLKTSDYETNRLVDASDHMSHSQQMTQIDGYTQGYTQELACYDNSSNDNINDTPMPWIRLVSLSSTVPSIELFPDAESERTQLMNPMATDYFTHTLGRSKKCKLLFKSQKVSNNHCNIFCKRVIVNNRVTYEPWIEDTSANGTYVNRVRLRKNTPKKLYTGDEVSLISFSLLDSNTLSKETFKKLLEELNTHAFIVTIPMNKTQTDSHAYNKTISMDLGSYDSVDENGPTPRKDGEHPQHNSSSRNVQRESTVVRMLHQGRDINDYYIIMRVLGSGGCGIVYEGRDKYTGVSYAIKKMDIRSLNLNATSPKEANTKIKELLKEAELMRTIEHSSIIKLYEVFGDDSYIYLVMELLTGGDLFDRLSAKGVYSEDDAKCVVKQLLEAIDFLHQKSIAHRDLKPENILLVSKYSDTLVKITDFGLAKQVGNGAKLKTYCGTPQYFAPEVYYKQNPLNVDADSQNLINGSSYTFAADMWSLGVMLYVLLSASYPFPDVRGVPTDMLNGKFEFTGDSWSIITQDCKEFISALLRVDPGIRLTASEALQHNWFVPPASTLVPVPVQHDVDTNTRLMSIIAPEGNDCSATVPATPKKRKINETTHQDIISNKRVTRNSMTMENEEKSAGDAVVSPVSGRKRKQR